MRKKSPRTRLVWTVAQEPVVVVAEEVDSVVVVSQEWLPDARMKTPRKQKALPQKQRLSTAQQHTTLTVRRVWP